jgi:hypothetical protein
MDMSLQLTSSVISYFDLQLGWNRIKAIGKGGIKSSTKNGEQAIICPDGMKSKNICSCLLSKLLKLMNSFLIKRFSEKGP